MIKVSDILKAKLSGRVLSKRESHRKKIINQKIKCEFCGIEPEDKSKLWRFRFNKLKVFSNENAIVTCLECRKILNKNLSELGNIPQAIIKTKIEVSHNGS